MGVHAGYPYLVQRVLHNIELTPVHHYGRETTERYDRSQDDHRNFSYSDSLERFGGYGLGAIGFLGFCGGFYLIAVVSVRMRWNVRGCVGMSGRSYVLLGLLLVIIAVVSTIHAADLVFRSTRR